MLCLSTLSTLVFALHQYQISLVSTVLTIQKAFHPVFEMFYSNLYRQCRHKPLLCSLSSIVQDQYWKAFPLGRGERSLYAEFSHPIEPQTPASTALTNIALNALISVLTVLTNKIPYSIHNSIALIFCTHSVDKQDTLLNTQ